MKTTKIYLLIKKHEGLLALLIGIITVIIGSGGIYYAVVTKEGQERERQEYQIKESITIARNKIDAGFACQEDLVSKATKGEKVTDEDLRHCYELIATGIEKLRKYKDTNQNQEAILELIAFYRKRNNPAFASTIKELENLLKNTP